MHSCTRRLHYAHGKCASASGDGDGDGNGDDGDGDSDRAAVKTLKSHVIFASPRAMKRGTPATITSVADTNSINSQALDPTVQAHGVCTRSLLLLSAVLGPVAIVHIGILRAPTHTATSARASAPLQNDVVPAPPRKVDCKCFGNIPKPKWVDRYAHWTPHQWMNRQLLSGAPYVCNSTCDSLSKCFGQIVIARSRVRVPQSWDRYTISSHDVVLWHRENARRGGASVIIHDSDENLKDNVSFYNESLLVIRQYWREPVSRYPNVITIPSGISNGWDYSRPVPPIDARTCNWIFFGGLGVTSQRTIVRRAMNYTMAKVTNKADCFYLGGHSRGKLSIDEYQQRSLNAIFAPCPGGTNPMTFRSANLSCVAFAH